MAIPELGGSNAARAHGAQTSKIDKAQAEKMFNIFESKAYAINDGKISNATEYLDITYYYDENYKSFTKEAKNYLKNLFSAFMDNDTTNKEGSWTYTLKDILRRFDVISKKNVAQVEKYAESHKMNGTEAARLNELLYRVKYNNPSDASQLAWVMDAMSYQKR